MSSENRWLDVEQKLDDQGKSLGELHGLIDKLLSNVTKPSEVIRTARGGADFSRGRDCQRPSSEIVARSSERC